jgi:hypothetical protein
MMVSGREPLQAVVSPPHAVGPTKDTGVNATKKLTVGIQTGVYAELHVLFPRLWTAVKGMLESAPGLYASRAFGK